MPTFVDQTFQILGYNSLLWSMAIRNSTNHYPDWNPQSTIEYVKNNNNVCKVTMRHEKKKHWLRSDCSTISPVRGWGICCKLQSSQLPGIPKSLQRSKWGGKGVSNDWCIMVINLYCMEVIDIRISNWMSLFGCTREQDNSLINTLLL